MLARPARAPLALPAAARARRARGGFTLVEIIVVISVIAILLSLLFTALRAGIGSSHARATSAVIAQVALAADQFKDTKGRYPYSRTATTTSGLSAEAIVEELGSMLKTRDTFFANVGGKRILIDAWGQPILYVRHIFDDELKRDGDGIIDKDVPRPIHNRKSYDIFSAGKLASKLPDFTGVSPLTATFQQKALATDDNRNYKHNGMTYRGEVNQFIGNIDKR